MFTPSFTPRGENSLHTVYKNGGANSEFHPHGITSTLREQLRPWGSKLAPRALS
jgi:hypothetical protein